MAGQSRRMSADVDSRAFRRALKKAMEGLAVESAAQVEEKAHEIRNYAVRYSPVDHGPLRASWQVESGKTDKGYYSDITNSQHYAAEVELGHKQTLSDGTVKEYPPQPMIRPAIAEALGVQGVGYDVDPT